MAKGVYKISGNTTPKVLEKNTYKVEAWYPETPYSERDSAKVTWELFVEENGKFRTTHIKKKGIGDFTFGKNAYKHTYKIEGYLYAPEGKEPMSLVIRPQKNDGASLSNEKEILGVRLTYEDGSKITKPLSYMDRLMATAKCQNLEGRYIIFELWEDDEKGNGHNKKNQPIIKSQPIRVDSRGYARWNFTLLNTFISLAQQREGEDKKHEYYVTAEYNGKILNNSGNINVNNPTPVIKITPKSSSKSKTTASTNNPQPKPQPNSAKGSTHQGSKNNQSDDKGIITSVKITDLKGQFFKKRPKFGERIQIVIEGKSIKGKDYTLRLWEDDTTGKNDLLYERKYKFDDNKQMLYVDLTEEMQWIGDIGNDKKNPDSGEYWTGNYQEIFAEVIVNTRTAQSQIINVDLEAEAKKPEKTRTPTKVGETKKKEDGKCPRCTNKVTYEELREIFKNGNEKLMKDCLPFINKYFDKFKINTCAKKAHFFAQVRVETDFVVLTENLKYSYDTLFNSDLKYYRGNDERCKKDAKQEKSIGNNAYGTRFNNRPNTDDGYNFRGRGLIMVTGRSNYETFQKFYDDNINLLGLEKTIFVTLNNKYSEEKPEKLAEPINGVLSAIHYWVAKGLNTVIDTGKVEEDIINLIVDAINKNTSSRDKRRASYQGGKYIFKKKEREYSIGTKKTFKVDDCLLYKVENKKQKTNTKYAPWMPFALGEIGQKAILGKQQNNPRINEYFNASTNGKGLNEETNWCGAFTSWCMVQAGYTPPPLSCRAAMWQFWKQDKPIYGSAAVIDWDSNQLAKPNGKNGAVGGAGHITFVVGISKDGNYYYCVGGNQGGTKGARTVKISKYSKNDIDWFVIPPNYTPEASEYKLNVMTSEADIDSSSTTRS